MAEITSIYGNPIRDKSTYSKTESDERYLQTANVDTELDNQSHNPVENAAITEAIDDIIDDMTVTKTASGNPIHITDAAAYPAESVVTTLEPVQDLHGYDKPWPAGGGGNILSTGNAFDVTVNDIRFQSDGNGTYTISGDASNSAYYTFDIPEITLSQSSIYVHLLNSIAISTGALEFFYNNTNLGFIAMLSQNRISNLAALSGATVNKLRLNFNDGISGSITLQPMLMLTDTVTSYTPYSNECPISGHTGVELTRTGKNLLDGTTFIRTNKSGQSNVNWARWDEFIPCIQSSYTLSCGFNVTLYALNVDLYDENQSLIEALDLGQFSSNGKTFSVENQNAKYMKISIYNNTSMENYDFSHAQLELGSTATSYEPYTPETHTITFPQAQSPVYGCEVDWTNGVLRVTKVNVDLGTLTWNYQSAYTRFVANLPNVKFVSGDFTSGLWSSCYQPNPSPIQNSGIDCTIAKFPQAIYVNNFSYTDAATFKTAMAGQQLVYELATPLEIALTPEIITLLKGENNIWLDAGTFEKFEYYPDTTIGEQIGELDNRVTDLELSIQALQAIGLTIVNGQLCQTYTE